MQKKYKNLAICATFLSLGLTGLATAECIPVRGKIFNNALGPGATLGTVHFIFDEGKDQEKLKCGLKGVGKYRDPDDDNYKGPLNFDHTMVCDDDVGDTDPIHSQLLWDTSGYLTDFPQECGDGVLTSFSFLEISHPVEGTGLFAGVTGGEITIEGTLFCTLAIDMKFSGELCYKEW